MIPILHIHTGIRKEKCQNVSHRIAYNNILHINNKLISNLGTFSTDNARMVQKGQEGYARLFLGTFPTIKRMKISRADHASPPLPSNT